MLCSILGHDFLWQSDATSLVDEDTDANVLLIGYLFSKAAGMHSAATGTSVGQVETGWFS
jgi:hypothetical protein